MGNDISDLIENERVRREGGNEVEPKRNYVIEAVGELASGYIDSLFFFPEWGEQVDERIEKKGFGYAITGAFGTGTNLILFSSTLFNPQDLWPYAAALGVTNVYSGIKVIANYLREKDENQTETE